MAGEVVQCPHCQGKEVVKYGTASKGKARYRCQQNKTCGRTFIGPYTYPGRLPQGKQQIVEMTRKGSGVGASARVLQGGPTTGSKEVKTRLRLSRR